MAWKYNPFTDALDKVGSGGASYIDGVVADPTALPVTLGTPALDSVFLAKAGSGVWLINRRPSGLYVRVANNGNLNDWLALGAFPEVNSSTNWELYDGTDPTKELKFDLGGISTGTTRTLTVPNASGRIQVEGQPIGNTTPSTGAFTTLSANNGTLTASAPVLDLSQTWNNAAVTFTGLRFNVTNTASAAASLLMDLQTASVSRFRVDRDGVMSSARVDCTGDIHRFVGATTFASLRSNGAQLAPSGVFAWGNLASNSSTDLELARDAADTLAQRRSTNPQTFRLYNTTDSGLTNFERGFMRWSSNVLQIGTEAGGTGSARALEFQTGGTTRCSIPATGGFNIFGSGGSVSQTYSQPFYGRLSCSITPASSISEVKFASAGATAGNGQTYFVIGSTDGTGNAGNNLLFGVSSGRAFLTNAVNFNNPSVLHLGGQGWGADGVLTLDGVVAGNTGVMVMRGLFEQRNGTNAQTFRIYNTVSGTGNVNFDRVNFRWASNEFIIDAEAGGTGTLRGIKIGSATSSLLGFYGATPVDRPATVADPAGGGTIDAEARTAINDIIDRLQELGLIA